MTPEERPERRCRVALSLGVPMCVMHRRPAEQLEPGPKDLWIQYAYCRCAGGHPSRIKAWAQSSAVYVGPAETQNDGGLTVGSDNARMAVWQRVIIWTRVPWLYVSGRCCTRSHGSEYVMAYCCGSLYASIWRGRLEMLDGISCWPGRNVATSRQCIPHSLHDLSSSPVPLSAVRKPGLARLSV